MTFLFEFDLNKSRRNQEKHGLDFTEAQELWKVPHVIFAGRNVDSETRSIIVGELQGRMHVAIFTLRGSTIRLISCHKADSRCGKENLRRRAVRKKKIKMISAEEFDRKFDNNEDIFDYVDFKSAVFVNRVNVDFPAWMIKSLDREATKLNVSRQAIIKMWIHDRLMSNHRPHTPPHP